MSLLTLVIVLVIMGVIAYFVQTASKLNATFKWIILAVLVIVALLMVLSAFGILDDIKGVKVPKVMNHEQVLLG